MKAERDDDAVQRVLSDVRRVAADPATNVMPALIAAVREQATLGEVVDALAGEFGRYYEAPVL